MSPPRITLVTPTYNQAEFLPEMLRSVDAQDYPNLEHIVVDALSTDATPRLLAEASAPHRRILREADRGQSDAINKGMSIGEGDIAGWLNSDDRLRPGALHAVANAFQAHPSATVVFGTGSRIDRGGSVVREIPHRPFDRSLLASAFYVLQPAMFFRREVFLEVGGLDENLEYAMDWDLLIRLARGRDVISIPDPIADLRCYPETKTASGGWRRMREIAEIGRRHNGILDRNHVSCVVRECVGATGCGPLKWCVDQFFWHAFPKRSLMVEGWP